MQQVLQIAALVFALVAPAGETEFDYWTNHKVGSWVKLKMELEAQGVKVSVKTHHTLLESTAEKVVVEQKNKVSANGMDQEESTEKEEIFKGKDKDPIKIEKESDEEIEVAGKKLKCHVIEGTQKETHKVKFWVSKDVPGGVVKAEISGGDIPGPMKIIATEWEKK
jgi:hypothetical protein